MERVDVTGEVCPRPALIVRRRLSELDPGEELLVRGDYPPAEENLRRTCRKHGFDVSGVAGSGESDVDRATSPGTEDGDGSPERGTFELKITVTEDATLR